MDTSAVIIAIDMVTFTIWFLEPDNRLTLINSVGRSYITVQESGVATFRYGFKVERSTTGAGARINRSNRTNSCYQCEEGNEFHFVLKL